MISIEFLIAASNPTDSSPAVVQPLLDWFHLADPWRRWLIAFGFAGQAVFFLRWVIQWIASERRGESHVPELFWWCSICGSLMLFTYFLLDHDPVGVLGQGVGWTIYSRNLYLIRVKHRHLTEGRESTAPPP